MFKWVSQPPGTIERRAVGDTQRDSEAIDAVIYGCPEWARAGHGTVDQRAVHPQAMVINASRVDDHLKVWPVDGFAEGIEEMQNKLKRMGESPRQLRIGLAKHVAAARLDFTVHLGDETFSGADLLSLSRLGDQWVIRHKLYDDDRPLQKVYRLKQVWPQKHRGGCDHVYALRVAITDA